MVFQIVYLWRGERHRGSKDYRSLGSAKADLAAYRADGWSAWIERVR